MVKLVFYLFSIHLILLPSNLPVSQYIFYILLIVLVIGFVIDTRNIKIDRSFLILLGIGLVSLLLNDIPRVFNSEIKFISYFLVIIVCSPFIQNRYLIQKRFLLYTCIENIAILVCLLSFLGLVLGVIPRVNPGDMAGGFSGVFKNTVTFGCICGLSILFTINRVLIATTSKKKIIYLVLTAIFLILLIISGSRAALISTIIGTFILTGKFVKFNLLRFFKKNFIYFIIIMVGFGVFLFKNIDLFQAMFNKNELGSNSSDIFYSRRVLWDNRWEEFFSSPIYGVGFNTITLKDSFTGYHPDSNTIESGSSWLFILSSLGILGFIFYIKWILGSFFKGILEKDLHKNKSIYLGIIAFFSINMIFEGYIFATSNVLTYVLFLSLNFLNYKGKKDEALPFW